jgi:hypothetical protein
MTQLVIDVGTTPNDGLGDPIRTAYQKCNTNFSELYSRVQTSVPPTLVGSVGDTAGMYAYDSTYFYYCFANYTGNSTVWGQVTDAADLTLTNIVNGNSNVNIATANGNITVAVTGTSNVLVFANTGAYVTGVVSATGNVSGGNLNVTGNIVDTGALSIITGANGNISLTPNGTGIVTSSVDISTTGNVTGNNINSTTTFKLAVFANATVRDSSISSPVAGMMIYVTGTGMQVRGATSWNTVAGTGT